VAGHIGFAFVPWPTPSNPTPFPAAGHGGLSRHAPKSPTRNAISILYRTPLAMRQFTTPCRAQADSRNAGPFRRITSRNTRCRSLRRAARRDTSWRLHLGSRCEGHRLYISQICRDDRRIWWAVQDEISVAQSPTVFPRHGARRMFFRVFAESSG
jgi:hypothetical protein